MKNFRLTVLLAAALVFSCTAPEELVLVPVDPMTKILPEAAAFLPLSDTTETAAGAHAEFQFAFRAPCSLKGVEVSCTPLESSGGKMVDVVRCGLVGLVGIGEPASDPAHDVIHSVSGMFPDPILTGAPRTIPAGQASSAWVTVKVPEDAAPGIYEGVFTFKAKMGSRRIVRNLPVTLRVWPVVMEKPSLLTVNWNFDFPECTAHWNGSEPVEPFSDLYWEYMEDMAGALREAHQNVTMVPVFGLVKMERGEDGRWTFNFDNFNRTARLYENAGVLERLQLGEIGHRIEPRWEAGFGLFVPDGKGGFEGHRIDDPCVKEFYSQFLPALRKNLRDNGWEEKAWQKVCDEPIDANAADYRRTIEFLRTIDPSMKVMEALQTTGLSGVMDVWVPQLDTWHNNFGFFQSRQKAGDEVWFYTCCYPRGEYPNRFIEQPTLKTRILYWMAFKYGATGYLHWGFNYWTGDPFGVTDRPGTGTTLPGGDCWIVYPGFHKFESSIRFEAMRDGIEDNTLLMMLRKKDPAAAESVCNRLIFNWWVYSTSASEFRSVRHELLRALSE